MNLGPEFWIASRAAIEGWGPTTRFLLVIAMVSAMPVIVLAVVL
jgi:hypothetical protein